MERQVDLRDRSTDHAHPWVQKPKGFLIGEFGVMEMNKMQRAEKKVLKERKRRKDKRKSHQQFEQLVKQGCYDGLKEIK